MNLQLLHEVTAFIWQEGDMLDHGEYDAWLKFWTEKGTYIIPINPKETDFENTLNYAYDDRVVTTDQEVAKRLHHFTGGVGAGVALGQHHAGGRHVQRQPQHGRDQQHGRERHEVERFLHPLP